MDIELLKTFIEVNRTRHFGHAADNLYLTQSAVSARIRLLEDTLGVVLFERQRNNLQLTTYGQRFLQHAKSIVSTWQQARQDVALADEFSTSLAVGGLVDLWEMQLIDWLINVRRQFPQIALHATAHAAESLVSQVINHQLDLAFLFETRVSNELESRYISAVHFALYATQAVSLEQALEQGFVSIDWGTAFNQSFVRCFSNIKPASLHMSHGALAMSYLLHQQGAAYFPVDWAETLIEQGKLYKIEDAPIIEREIYAIWRTGNERQPVINDVLALLRAP